MELFLSDVRSGSSHRKSISCRLFEICFENPHIMGQSERSGLDCLTNTCRIRVARVCCYGFVDESDSVVAFRTSTLAGAVCLTTEERRSESPEDLLPVREVFASSPFFPATGFWVVAG